MDSLRLPWRRRPRATHVEPTLIAEQEPPAEPAPEFNASFKAHARDAKAHARDARDADPILSLIGGADVGARAEAARHDLDGKPAASSATDAAPCAADLIASLHGQYWRALTDPQASITESWVDQSDEAPADVNPDLRPDLRPDLSPNARPHAMLRYADEEAAHEASANARQDSPGSIETLLSGESTIDDCFGRLKSLHMQDLLDLAADSAPDVLRLFAPPDYCAAMQLHPSARASALPPPLTRREHHVLSIDSPLVAPSLTQRSVVSPCKLDSVEQARSASERLSREADVADATLSANAKAIDEQA